MRRRVLGAIFHWSASASPLDTVDTIRRTHLAKGWKDIAYHRVILHPKSREFQGKPPVNWWDLVKQGRSLNEDIWIEDKEMGAHALGYNRDYVGVCTIGGPSFPLHPLQRKAVIEVAKVFSARFQYPLENTKGHREVNPTQCPGDEIMKLIKEIRA